MCTRTFTFRHAPHSHPSINPLGSRGFSLHTEAQRSNQAVMSHNQSERGPWSTVSAVIDTSSLSQYALQHTARTLGAYAPNASENERDQSNTSDRSRRGILSACGDPSTVKGVTAIIGGWQTSRSCRHVIYCIRLRYTDHEGLAPLAQSSSKIVSGRKADLLHNSIQSGAGIQ